jgi:aspartate aminotransferase-like enzyme
VENRPGEAIGVRLPIRKERLFTPGPTPVPSFVTAAMTQATALHHRHPEFREIWQRVCDGLPALWGVSEPVVLMAGSGTAGMEALVANLFEPGEKVIVGSIGKFGERWIEIARQRGLDVVVVERPYGYALSPESVEAALAAHPDTAGFLLQACETSTGVENPLGLLAEVLAGRSVLWVVDAISGMGTMPIEVTAWGIDGLVTASQKAWMLPPGLAMVYLSPRAWAKARRVRTRPYYLDLVRLRATQEEGDSAFTPAIPLVVGLGKVIDYIRGLGGLESLVQNSRQLAEYCRRRLTEGGWTLFAKEHPAGALTAVEVPSGWDGVAWVRKLREDYGLIVAGGQGSLKGRIFRVAHMGYVDLADVAGMVACLEEAYRSFGTG